MPNVMVALLNIGGTLCSTPQTLADPTSGVLCSNTANIGECKTWTQSEFCTWQNSIRRQELPKMYSVAAQETAKNCAKFGWHPMNDIAAVTKPRHEAR